MHFEPALLSLGGKRGAGLPKLGLENEDLGECHPTPSSCSQEADVQGTSTSALYATNAAWMQRSQSLQGELAQQKCRQLGCHLHPSWLWLQACPAPSWVTAKLCEAQARSELIRATITENQLALTQPHQCKIQPSSPSRVLPKEKPPRWATAGALSACPGSAGTL